MHNQFAGLIKAHLERDHKNTTSEIPLEMLNRIVHGNIPYETTGELSLKFDLSDDLVKTKYRDDRQITLEQAKAKLEAETTKLSEGNWAEVWFNANGDLGSTFQDLSVDYWHECHTCDGTGAEECTSCSGKKTQRCGNSCSSGYVKCSKCNGHGSPACTGCHGVGTKQVTTNYPVMKTEHVVCNMCFGSKRFGLCYHCTGGRQLCISCDGKGDVPCQGCRGKGKVSCRTCEGVGTAGYRRTAKPVVTCRVKHTAQSDVAIFDLMRTGTASFLRPPQNDRRKTGLKVTSSGKHAEFTYSSSADYAYSSLIKGDDIAAYVAMVNEASGVESGGGYIERIVAPTNERLSRREYGVLNTYPLGRSCLKVLADKSAEDDLFDAYGGHAMMGNHIDAAGKDVMRHVQRGRWLYIAAIWMIALIASFLAFNPGMHFLLQDSLLPKELWVLAILIAGATLSAVAFFSMKRGQARRANLLIGDGYRPRNRMHRISVAAHVTGAVIGYFAPIFM